MEEMAEDDLDIFDIQQAVLNGQDVRRNKKGSPWNEISPSKVSR
jgi:hypothetical protein